MGELTITIPMKFLIERSEEESRNITLAAELANSDIGNLKDHMKASIEALGKLKMIHEIMEVAKNNLNQQEK